LDNFGGASAIEWSLEGEALGDDALRFASHEESYVIEGFGYLNFWHSNFLKEGYIPGHPYRWHKWILNGSDDGV
jgi:hypothetical protein